MSCDERPELSVIVPVYNEGALIASFLREMARQQNVRMEVIVSDGGSTDNTTELAAQLSQALPFPVTVIRAEKGRARQMNLGAGVARAATLLFLHADSGFPDPHSFRCSLDRFAEASRCGTDVAARFSLEFELDSPPPLPYRYYSTKATLDRHGCTHGDQGLLIGKEFFRVIGPFDPDLPLMEDTFLAERVRERGRWLLLSSRIRTSPRRFQAEGLLPRQTLNAVVMDLAFIGHMELVEALKGCYRTQDAAGRLRLAPFLSMLRERIAALPAPERRRLWHDTGSYVRYNAWQIPFFLDVVCGTAREGKGGRFLRLHDLFFDRLTGNRAGNWCAAALVWIWFRIALRASRREGGPI